VDRNQTRVMKGLDGADRWFDENGVALTATPAIDTHHRALKDTIARAKHHAAQQDERLAPKVVTTKDKDVLRQRITDELRDVAQLSRQLRKTIPGIGALVAPKPTMGIIQFLRNAESFTEKATTYAQVLIEHGMSPDFVTSLKSGLRQLEDVVTTRAAARSDRVAATVSLNRELKKGLAIVDILDVSVKRALRDSDPGRLAGWQAAKRATALHATRTEPTPAAPRQVEGA